MPSPRRLVIVGAGGYARCVADAAEASGAWVVDCFLEREPAPGQKCLGRPVRAEAEALADGNLEGHVAVALGDNSLRERVAERLAAVGAVFPIIVHPRAAVSASATLGEGAVLLAGSAVGPSAVVGRHVSLYSNAVVEHDCRVADFVTLAPAAALGGTVRLGARSFIGLGAIVSHGVELGDDTIVGAGGVVLSDHPGAAVLVGAPARMTKSRQPGDPYL